MDTTYNPNTTKGPEPIIKINYKVTGDTRFILIVEHEEDKTQWA